MTGFPRKSGRSVSDPAGIPLPQPRLGSISLRHFKAQKSQQQRLRWDSYFSALDSFSAALRTVSHVWARSLDCSSSEGFHQRLPWRALLPPRGPARRILQPVTSGRRPCGRRTRTTIPLRLRFSSSTRARSVKTVPDIGEPRSVCLLHVNLQPLI